MEWSEFLNDRELNTGVHGIPPNGKLLFRKISHDVLECLSGFQECIRIATTLKEDVPKDTLSWLVRWEAPIESWIIGITSLEKQFGGLPSSGLEWPELIAEIGTLLTQVPEFKKDAEALTLPSLEKLRLTIQTAIRFTERLNLLWIDIQAKEYKRLWTLQRYSDLLE